MLTLFQSIGSFLAPFSSAILGWFFSGSTTTTVGNSPGVDGLDKETLSGTSNIKPVVLAFACVLLLGVFGCVAINVGGAHEDVIVTFVEPGAVVEIVTDKPQDVVVSIQKPDGTVDKKVASKNIGGMVAMPKSVYREILVKAYPELKDAVAKAAQDELMLKVK